MNGNGEKVHLMLCQRAKVVIRGEIMTFSAFNKNQRVKESRTEVQQEGTKQVQVLLNKRGRKNHNKSQQYKLFQKGK